MVAPGHAIATDVEFASEAVRLLTSSTPPRRSEAVSETFTARRSEALTAHATLVETLLAGR
jgi:hypothetical protein